MKYSIGLPNKNVQQRTRLLPSPRADKMILNAKTYTFHSTESYESGKELHKLFQEQYVDRRESNDKHAEPRVKLDGLPIGTMKEPVTSTRLQEANKEFPRRNDMLKDLSDNYAKAIIQHRKDISANE